MNFENDVLTLKEAVGKDTEVFMEVFDELYEKYPDKRDLIIGVVEQELAERGKRTDAFIKEAIKVLQLEEELFPL